MADDLGGEAITMVGRDRGAHPRIMKHEEADDTYPFNLTIPSKSIKHIMDKLGASDRAVAIGVRRAIIQL
jgi:hypothetical protein